MENDAQRFPVTDDFYLYIKDIQIDAMRARGAGGQNVNKVSSAVHLRYDLNTATLPESVRQRLLNLRDNRITDEGVVVIRADRLRTQARNRRDAIDRLLELLRSVAKPRKKRIPTRPTRGAVERRLSKKNINSKNKQLRKKPSLD